MHPQASLDILAYSTTPTCNCPLFAAHVLHGVPHTGVGLGSIRSELFFGITEAVVGAITRTYSTFTCDAVVVVKAIALASLGKTWEVEGFGESTS